MSFRTTIVLVILMLVGLGVWMLVSAPREGVLSEGNENAAERKTHLVFEDDISDDQIVRLRIERPNQPALAFERDPNPEGDNLASSAQREWRMVEPVVAGAQTWTVDSFVNQLVDLEAAPLPKTGESVDAKTAGLEPAAARVMMEDQSGKRYELEIGRKPALSNDTYVRKAGEQQIRVANTDLTRDLKKSVNDFRSRKLLNVKPAEVNSIHITHGDREYRLLKEGENWEIKSPVETPAESAKVTALLNKLSYISIADFVDDAPPSLSTYGFDPAFERIEVRMRAAAPAATQPSSAPAERTEVLLVGGFADAAHEKRFVKTADQPWVASVRVSDLEPLTPNLTELRDPRVTRVNPGDARQIEIVAGDSSATLRLESGRWTGEGDLAQLELPAVTELLEAFQNVRAMEYIAGPVDLAQYGLDNPRSRITVQTADDRSVTLKIGDATRSGRNAYAQRNDDAEVLVISQQQAAQLSITPLALRARDMLTVAPADVRQVQIEQGGQTTVAIRSENDGWSLQQPEGAPIDTSAAESISRDLARLRAKRVVGRDNPVEFGLSEPTAVVTFTVQERKRVVPESQPSASAPAESPPAFEDLPSQEHVLRLARHNASYFGQVDSNPYIFELEPSVYRSLTGELIQRKLFSFDAKSIERLRVSNRADTIDFERTKDGWTYTADPYVTLAKEKVEETATTLAGLMVEDFTRWSGADESGAGLGEEPFTLSATAGEHTYTLKIARNANADELYAALWIEQGRAFTLRKPEVEKLTRKLEQYLQPDGNANANVAAPPAGDLGLE